MLEHLQWLAGKAGSPLLAEIMQRAESGDSVNQLANAARKQVGIERARTLLTLIELRRRATKKFSRANQMWMTRVGYEQSSSETISRYKARRFLEGSRVVDFCCGIGGDLIGLADRVSVTGIDRDPICCWMAVQNSIAYGNAEVDVVEADVETSHLQGCNAWHMDPDRRATSNRTTQVEYFAPGKKVIDDLLECQPNAAIKLAPATDCPDDWLERCEREWIGDKRECKQQVAWFGSLTKNPSLRAATIVGDGQVETLVEDPTADLDHAAGSVGAYLCECHPSVLAAGLLSTAAKQFGMIPLAPGHALLASESKVNSSLVKCFRVLTTMRLNKASIELALREHSIGSVEVKCHGIKDERWRRWRPRCEGANQATLVLTRLGNEHVSILAKRVLADGLS